MEVISKLCQSIVTFNIEYIQGAQRCRISDAEDREHTVSLMPVSLGVEPNTYWVFIAHYIVNVIQSYKELAIKKVLFQLEQSKVGEMGSFFSIIDQGLETNFAQVLGIEPVHVAPKEIHPNVLPAFLISAEGDALGYQIEFEELPSIIDENDGKLFTEFQQTVSDDTQMTIFSYLAAQQVQKLQFGSSEDLTENMQVVNIFFGQFLDWFDTQQKQYNKNAIKATMALSSISANLCHQRAPGNTCLSALSKGTPGTLKKRVNSSKGCGTIMRNGMNVFIDTLSLEHRLQLSAIQAATTHGNDAGIITCVFETLFEHNLMQNREELAREKDPVPWHEYIAAELKSTERQLLANRQFGIMYQYSTLKVHVQRLQSEPAMSEQFTLDGRAYQKTGLYQGLLQYGEGWVADEALCIAIYALLQSGGVLRHGLYIAANHGGDSDSTACIMGELWGSFMGYTGACLGMLGNDVTEEIALVVYGSDFL